MEERGEHLPLGSCSIHGHGAEIQLQVGGSDLM